MGRNRRNNRKNKHINDDTKKITNVLLKVIFILVILFLIIVIFNIAKNWINYHTITEQYLENLNTVENSNKAENLDNQEASNTDTTFNLTAIGDIMCHNTQYMDAYNSSTGEYDFSYVFDDISYYIKNSSITVANLETTFAGEDKGYSNYPRFNTPDALAYNLKKLGIDVISTAGNHSLDYGFDGLSRTIDVLNSADISHVGTYKTQEERDTIVFKYVKGVKIAFINYAYGTNGITIPSDKPFCINLIDKELIKKDIDNAKSQNADMIVASVHWGTEYSTVPNDTQNELADFLFQNGVNIILGTHPHVLQKMEKRTVTLEDGSTREVMHFSPALAPYKVAVLPLVKKYHSEKANEIYEELSKHFSTSYDETGNIGKRYRRQDAIGTPFAITIDDETLKEGTVTVRDRDTMEQITLKLEEVVPYIEKHIQF